MSAEAPGATGDSPASAGPLVSVVIPVFNGERHLGEALASVLTQSHRALEVLVVDDGSTDGSIDVARRAADRRCRCLRQARQGAAAARNLGAGEAQGMLLAFLDADDLWLPDKLELQVRALAADPALDMVFAWYAEFGAAPAIAGAPVARPGYAAGTMLIRRDSFLRVGAFSTRWRVGEFIDWYARAEEAGLRHAMLSPVLLRRRVHDGNATRRERSAFADYARIVHAAARRRRLHPPEHE